MALGGRHAFYPYIDGLRAVSIISVVLFHLYARILPGGFAGVDIFFTISGFVVSSSLHAYKVESFRNLLAFFYARRFRRIVPALLLVLLVTSAVSTMFSPAPYLSRYTQDVGRAAFFGYSNIALARGIDYFSPLGQFNPFTHTWSLAVEEQFYVIFPFTFFALRRTGHISRRALAALLALCLASFIYGLMESRFSFSLGFYSSLARFWEIGSGVALYAALAASGRFDAPVGRENRLATAVGATLIALAFVLGTEDLYPVPGAVPAVGGALLILYGLQGAVPASPVARLLTRPAMLWIGAISYSLYLWHWPIFVMFRWTVGFGSLTNKLMALALAIAAATASYYLVERPLRRAALLQPARRAIPVALIALVIGWKLAGGLLGPKSWIALSTVNRNLRDWTPSMTLLPPTEDGCRVVHESHTVGPLTRLTVTREGCDRKAAPHVLFVLGDSHALAYADMFDLFALATGVRVERYDLLGCSFLQLEPLSDRCRPIEFDAVTDIAARIAPGDVLFTPSLRVPRFVNEWDEKQQETDSYFRRIGDEREETFAQAVSLLAKIARPGVRIVFELPKPVFRIPLFRCVDWFNRSNPVCAPGSEMDRAFFEKFRAPVVDFVSGLQARFPELSVWDATPYLCSQDTCSMWRDGKPMFFDGDHVSAYADRVLYPEFRREMARYGLGEAAAGE